MLLAREAKKVHKSKAKVQQASRSKGHLGGGATTSSAAQVPNESSALVPQLPALTATNNIIQQQADTGKHEIKPFQIYQYMQIVVCTSIRSQIVLITFHH